MFDLEHIEEMPEEQFKSLLQRMSDLINKADELIAKVEGDMKNDKDGLE